MQIATETFSGLSYRSVASAGFPVPQNPPCLGQAGTCSAQPGIATQGCVRGSAVIYVPGRQETRRL